MSLESDARAVSCRKALKVAVSALASEAGFERAEEAAVETLTEMLQSCEYNLAEITVSTLRHLHLFYTYRGIQTDI